MRSAITIPWLTSAVISSTPRKRVPIATGPGANEMPRSSGRTDRPTNSIGAGRNCIEWHRRSHKAIPFWVAVEPWDFGVVSKYYEMLKRRYQKFESPSVLG